MGAWLKIADQNQIWIALAALVFVLAVERLWPRRRNGFSWKRWAVAIFVAGLGILLTTYAQGPILQLAAWVTRALNLPQLARLGMPDWLLIIASLLLVDLLAYGSHLMFHQIPWLWRLHKLHHADDIFDATTGVLHHPLEAAAGLLIQYVILAALGVPLLVIILHAVVMQVQTPLSHGNLRLPRGVDQALRIVLVTPDVHRVHHSARLDESNRNFGMLFSFWDRLFGTYRAQPEGDQVSFGLGLPEEGPPAGASFLGALLMPLRARVTPAVSGK